MINLKIVLPGECPIKKNCMGELWFRKDKATGLKIPLKQPVKYYSQAYVEWAEGAVQHLFVWKQRQSDFKILSGSYFITFLFFRKTSMEQVIDLSNLYEAPQDVLQGKAGNFLDMVKTIKGIRHIVKYDHDRYKILAEDSHQYITSHGASHIFYDPLNPRTEIYISEFNLQKLFEVFKLIHPDQEIGYQKPEEPKLPGLDTLDINELIKGL